MIIYICVKIQGNYSRYAHVLNFLYIYFFSKEELNAEKDGSLHVSIWNYFGWIF